MTRGHVMEIFSAIQGEGPWVGIPQVFFRLFRCNLRCVWCDTPESFELTGKGKLEELPGTRQFKEFHNPITPETSLNYLKPFLELPHHSISFTGGEPLMQKDFLRNLFPLLKEKKEKIFLETGGSTPELLEPLLPYIDYISMDFKLPSSAKEKPLWDKHEKFLKLAIQKETYVKIVLTKDTKLEELEKALQTIQGIASEIPVILQPVTPMNKIDSPTETQMLRFQKLAWKRLPVRVIPQVHKLMGQQ